MVLMYHFSDLSDFQRFLYDKTHQISDFFEETLPKMARFLQIKSTLVTFGSKTDTFGRFVDCLSLEPK